MCGEASSVPSFHDHSLCSSPFYHVRKPSCPVVSSDRLVGSTIVADHGEDDVGGSGGAGDDREHDQKGGKHDGQSGDNDQEPAEIATSEDGCRG